MSILNKLKLNELKNQLLVLSFGLILIWSLLFVINFFSNRNIRTQLENVKGTYTQSALLLEQIHADLSMLSKGGEAAGLTGKASRLEKINQQFTDVDIQNNTANLLNLLWSITENADQTKAGEALVSLESLQKNHQKGYNSLLSSIDEAVSRQNTLNLVFILFGAGFALVFGYSIRKSLIKSLNRPIDLMQNLSHGKLPENIKATKNEFNVLINSANQLVDNLKAASNFALEIGQGKFDDNFKTSSDDDILGNALINMRDQLLRVDEESRKRNWANEGYAKFGDILRKQSDDMKDFGFSIISGLVKYINGNQGAIYVVQEDVEDETQLVLTRIGTYAFGRNKYMEDVIKPGAGLVGQAFLEQDTIHMIDIPEDYLRITSGLGDSPPRSLIIIPMKFNGQVYGIMEIASFNQFKEHEVEFLETIAESIASTISNVRINEQTKKLLSETQEQAEQLKSQEEEMRQNMEELSATNEQVERLKQEEDRKQKEMIKNIEDNKDMLMRVIDNIPGKIFVKDNESRIILLNKAVANAYNLPKEKLINTTDFEFFSTEDATEYRKIEKEIMDTGKIEHIPEEIFKDKEGNVRILDTIKMPFKISGDDRVGLLGVQTDVTDIKTMERQLQEQKTVMQKEIDELKAEIERLQSK